MTGFLRYQARRWPGRPRPSRRAAGASPGAPRASAGRPGQRGRDGAGRRVAGLGHDDQDGARHHGAGGVQRVAAEHVRHLAQQDVAGDAARHGGEGAEEHRRQPAQAGYQGDLGAGRGPAAERDRVDVEVGVLPEPFAVRQQEDQRRPAERSGQVDGMDQGQRRPALQQDVPNDPAGQPGRDGHHRDAEQVELAFPGLDRPQQRIGRDAGQVQAQGEVSQHGGRGGAHGARW